MKTYRDARNLATGAQSSNDEFVHLVTEAALNQASGIPVDKAALIASLTPLIDAIAAKLAEAMAVIEAQ